MLARVKAFCLHSLTIAWGYALAIVGGVMSVVDNVGDALGDPNLKDQISAAIGDTPDRQQGSVGHLRRHDPGAAEVTQEGRLKCG